MKEGHLVSRAAPGSYRSDLGAALARIDALKSEKEPSLPTPALPTKRELFQRVQDSFVSEPERWSRRTIVVEHGPTVQDGARDGWVRDFAAGQEALGFYLTGFWWIRVGTMFCGSYESARTGVDKAGYVYIFCPRFRRTIRKHRNWLLLKGLSGK